MITVTSASTKPYALIGHADGLPYGFPADTVAVDDWAVSSISGAGADGRGYESLVRRIIDRDSEETKPHPDLYGRLFPSAEAANQAYYEAGVTTYFIRLDSPEYAKAMEIIGRWLHHLAEQHCDANSTPPTGTGSLTSDART